MRPSRASVALLSIVVPCLLFTEVPANAQDDCPPGTTFDGSGCVTPPLDEDLGVPNETGCAQKEPLVNPAPCIKDGYEYAREIDRYIRAVDPQRNELYRPPHGALSHLGYWRGAPDEGWMYEWRKLAGWGGGIHWGAYGLMWLAEAPGTGQPVVDPEAVAQSILDGMERQPVEIGMAPAPLAVDSDSMGLVGAPVWMWVADPGPHTWGPVEESATVGGVTVTVTARAEHVRWSMGDGAEITCTTPGEPYRISYGVRDSPNCGHRYERTSRGQPGTAYDVSATTTWTAQWNASTGASGELEAGSLTSTAQVRIGERQVIEVG